MLNLRRHYYPEAIQHLRSDDMVGDFYALVENAPQWSAIVALVYIIKLPGVIGKKHIVPTNKSTLFLRSLSLLNRAKRFHAEAKDIPQVKAAAVWLDIV